MTFMATSSSSKKIRQVQLVGRKIRQLRRARQLTQTELSARIGVQQSDLSRMEKGEYRVSLDTLFRILSEFQISIGEFFEEMGGSPLSERELKLLHDFKLLSPASQRDVEEFVSFKRGVDKSTGPEAEA